MITAVVLFSVGLVGGFGVWWFSLDRRRGKEARQLAQTHHLHVDAVHEAYVRALRYGYAGDFTFLVRKAHPQADQRKVVVLRPEGNLEQAQDTSFVVGDKDVH